jgi:hypothetical protein
VRVPTLAISAWIPERTVVSDAYLGTSLLATMRERWNLGSPFTARDASAPSFARVPSLSAPRTQEDWPDVTPRPVPAMPEALFELDAPLGDLGYALVSGAVALARSFGKSALDTKADPTMPGEQALALAREALGDVFPSCAPSGSSRGKVLRGRAPCLYSANFVKRQFCELRMYGVLGSSRRPGPTPLSDPGRDRLCADRTGL